MLSTSWFQVSFSFEEIPVLLYKTFPLVRKFIFVEYRINRTRINASATIDTFFWMDIKLVIPFIYAIHGASIDAGFILYPDAGLSNDIGHINYLLE
jgi:hypothetical protein